MTGALSVVLFLVALTIQSYLVWRIDTRKIEEDKCEFLAFLYTFLLGVGVTLPLLLLHLPFNSAIAKLGFGAIFGNYLLFTGVGLANKPVGRLLSPYTLYSCLIAALFGLFVWWAIPRM